MSAPIPAISPVFPDDLVAPMAQAAATPSVAPSATATNGAAFGDMVTQGLNDVNEKLLVNQTDLQRLATGDTQNLHQVMIRLEESRVSFQLMMQVRNRLLEAYQDVMKMQV